MADRRAVRSAAGDEQPLVGPRRARRKEPEAPQAGQRDVVDDEREFAGRQRSALTARKAAEAALRQIAEFTTKQAEGVTGVERTEDGWVIGIEVVEDRRIPSSTDILATYEAAIDDNGELMSYRRTRRYARGRGDDGGEA